MRENTSMEAYMDDYGEIVVLLSQRFYNGGLNEVPSWYASPS